MSAPDGGPFVTTDAEADELEVPSVAELVRLRAKWQARVKGAAAGLLDAGFVEFDSDELSNATKTTNTA